MACSPSWVGYIVKCFGENKQLNLLTVIQVICVQKALMWPNLKESTLQNTSDQLLFDGASSCSAEAPVRPGDSAQAL